jgi:hypothetical protein
MAGLDEAGHTVSAEDGTTTPPTTGNAESAAEAETPEQPATAAPMNWLSGFAGLIFG